MALLSRNQALFASRLAARTGLNPRLIGAWLIAEEPAGANAPVGHTGDQNWLNIGNTDSKWYAGAGAWKDPVTAADKSAAWLQGKYSVPGFGRAASGIVNFSKTAGQPIGQQIGALQRSGWATSGYPDLPGLVQQTNGKLGLRPYMQQWRAQGAGQAPQLGRPQEQQQVSIPGAPTFHLQERNVFDADAFDRASRAFTLGQILRNRPQSPFSSVGAKPRGFDASNPLLAVLPVTAPDPTQYQRAVSTLQEIAGKPIRFNVPRRTGAASAAETAKGKAILAPGADRAGTPTNQRITDFVSLVAGSIKRPITITTGTNHSQMTTSGNVSDHWEGNAADIGMAANGGSDNSREGDMIAGRALTLAGIPRLKARQMAQQGGVFNITPDSGPLKGMRMQLLWKTDVGGNHHNHVHIGIRPA